MTRYTLTPAQIDAKISEGFELSIDTNSLIKQKADWLGAPQTLEILLTEACVDSFLDHMML